MELTAQFDELGRLIEERENHGQLKGLLVFIRDYVQRTDQEKMRIAEHASALELEKAQMQKAHAQSESVLKAENAKLVAENQDLVATIARLQTPDDDPMPSVW